MARSLRGGARQDARRGRSDRHGALRKIQGRPNAEPASGFGRRAGGAVLPGSPRQGSARTSTEGFHHLPLGFFPRFLKVANLGIHPHVLAPALDEQLARLEVVAVHGELRRALELVRPFAERVTEPRRFGLELGQAQLLPDYLRALHVLALGQRDRRKILLHRRVDQHRSVFALVSFAPRSVPLVAMMKDLKVERGVRAIGHGPEQCVRVVRVDVFVYGNHVLARRAVTRSGAVERAPDLRPRRLAVHDEHHHLAQIRERLVHRNALHALDAERIAQVVGIERLERDALDQARLARGHLRDDRCEDRVLAPGDAGHFHESVVLLQVDVPVGFSERRLGLEILGVDVPLHDDLRFRRYEQVDGLRLYDVDRRADEPSGHVQLVQRLRHLLRRGERHARRRAQYDRRGQLLAARLHFLPVGVDSRAQLERRVHSEAPWRLHLPAIDAHVLDARIRVLGDVLRKRRERRDVPAGRGNGDGQTVEPIARPVEVLALDHDLVTRRVLDDSWRDRFRHRAVPGLVDSVQGTAHADAVDLPARGERADHDRDLVFASLAVGYVSEQERFSVRLLDTAAELPAYERVHFGVFVDRPIDRYEQPRGVKGLQVLVEIGIAVSRGGACTAALRFGRRADFGFLRHKRGFQCRKDINATTKETSSRRVDLPALG